MSRGRRPSRRGLTAGSARRPAGPPARAGSSRRRHTAGMQQLGEREDLEALLGRATELAVAWGSERGRLDHHRPGAGDPAPVRRVGRGPRGPAARGRGRRPLPRPRSAAPRRRDRAPVRDGAGRVRPRAAGARARGRRRQRRPRARGGAARGVGPARGRDRRRRGARRGRRWTGWTRTARRAASCWRCSATRRGRGSGPGSARRRSSTRSTRPGAAIDAGAELVRVDVPPSRELAERTARTGRPVERWRASAVVARRPRRVRPVRAADPDRGPARARRPAPVRRRGGRAPSRLRPDHDRRPGARRAGPGGRRGVRADRPRHRGPDARDRRRPGGPGPGDRRPRVRAPAAGPRRHAGARPGRAADRRRRTSRRACRPIRRRAPGARSPCSSWPWPSRAATACGADSVVVGRVPGLAGRRVRGAGAGRRGDRAAPGAAPGPPARVRRAAPLRPDLALLWHAIVGALLADAGDALAVVRASRRDGHRGRLHAGRRPASPTACARRASRPSSRGRALDHATRRASRRRRRRCAALEDGGWTQPSSTSRSAFAAGRLGAEAVAERTEAFDPLAVVPTGGVAPSEAGQAVGLGVVDEPPARRAVPAGLERRPAQRVAQRLARPAAARRPSRRAGGARRRARGRRR